MTINRRELLTYGASALGVAAVGLPHFASAEGNELTIAYNVNLPSWDPTTGPSAVKGEPSCQVTPSRTVIRTCL